MIKKIFLQQTYAKPSCLWFACYVAYNVYVLLSWSMILYILL